MNNQKYFGQISRAGKLMLFICLSFVCANRTFAQNSDPKLSELQNQFAVNYLKPDAHFALAQYYLGKNDKLQAFFILEYARRYRFSEEDFDAAFKKFFGDHSAEPADQAKEAFEEGYRLLKKDQFNEAEKSFVKAAQLAPESSFIQTWVGRFFYKVKLNNEQALQHYFDAYFLDPHAYETEYVESRIRNISIADADARFAELIKSGKSLPEISTNTNQLIVFKAVQKMANQWKKEYVKPVLESMSNDDSLVRWLAFTTLYKNAGAAFDQILAALLEGKDLRKRGLAAYAVVERGKEKDFEILKKMLADKAELIRFDAASALALQGGQIGIEILRKHQKTETNSRLKKQIAQMLKEKSN